MNEKQTDLILQIVKEQLADVLAPVLSDEVLTGIRMGLFDNLELLEKLGRDSDE